MILIVPAAAATTAAVEVALRQVFVFVKEKRFFNASRAQVTSQVRTHFMKWTVVLLREFQRDLKERHKMPFNKTTYTIYMILIKFYLHTRRTRGESNFSLGISSLFLHRYIW
jgi:hypothetical protein